MNLNNLTSAELILHADNAYNALTSTDLEHELAKRLGVVFPLDLLKHAEMVK